MSEVQRFRVLRFLGSGGGVVLKDERPTSNIEHGTSNNDVASLLNKILLVSKNPMSNLE
jgi:hypothetical protein